MKRIGFFDQLHGAKLAKANGIIRAAENKIPICQKCRKPVENVQIQDRGPDPDRPMWMEIWASCHGAEDYARIEFVTPTPPELWATAMATGNFFAQDSDDMRLK